MKLILASLLLLGCSGRGQPPYSPRTVSVQPGVPAVETECASAYERYSSSNQLPPVGWTGSGPAAVMISTSSPALVRVWPRELCGENVSYLDLGRADVAPFVMSAWPDSGRVTFHLRSGLLYWSRTGDGFAVAGGE